jgi:hypothetical protein
LSWVGIFGVSLVAYLTKLAGIAIPQQILERPYFAKLALLLPTALLAAVQVFGAANQVVIDARAIGLLAGIIAYKLRAPFIVIVIAAASAAAAIRFLTGIN